MTVWASAGVRGSITQPARHDEQEFMGAQHTFIAKVLYGKRKRKEREGKKVVWCVIRERREAEKGLFCGLTTTKKQRSSALAIINCCLQVVNI